MRALLPSDWSVLGTAVQPTGGVRLRNWATWWETMASRRSPGWVPAGAGMASEVAALAAFELAARTEGPGGGGGGGGAPWQAALPLSENVRPASGRNCQSQPWLCSESLSTPYTFVLRAALFGRIVPKL